MTENPFDEFKKIEEMFKRAMEGMDGSFEGTGYSVSIKRIGGETKVDVSGDVSDDDIEMLKRKYPDAEITVNESDKSDPVEVLDDEARESRLERDEDDDGAEIEVIDEEEADPSELALKRFREKQEDDSEE